MGGRTYRALNRRHLDELVASGRLTEEQRFTVEVVSTVLPFKTNAYVCDELIDWSRVPDDPMFQLTFPQEGMLLPEHFARIAALLRRQAPQDEVDAAVAEIRWQLNPHPSGQKQHNVPELDGEPLPGMQHKYRETVLFFPAQGQTCHAYCTYCFRWPQFVQLGDLKFASKEVDVLVRYLRAHPEVTDVIFTGGDPMIMRTDVLRAYVEPLLAPDLAHVNVRIGTKALAYSPNRFTTDDDADDLMALFEQVVAAGRHLAIMAHWSHPVELSTPIAREAVRRVRATGAEIRAQAPLIRHVNDDPDVWAEMASTQVHLGVVPYYMFVERDTGARHYFEVPLVRALDVYQAAMRQVSGLGRTLRGPVMSATPGKIVLDGVTEIGGERVLALRLLQSRDPSWSFRPFFAAYDEKATWFDQLRPAFDQPDWFFGNGVAARPHRPPEWRRLSRHHRAGSLPAPQGGPVTPVTLRKGLALSQKRPGSIPPSTV